MKNLLHATWWKYLSIALLLYVIVGGLLVPLGPGVQEVKVRADFDNKVAYTQLKLYNTDFSAAAGAQKIWLKHGEAFACMYGVDFTETGLKGYFNLDDVFVRERQGQFVDIIVNNDINGTFGLRDAFRMPTIPADSAELIDDMNCGLIANTNEASYAAFPYREVLHETIRNLFYHVPMWFAMLGMLFISLIYSIKHLSSGNLQHDLIASRMAYIGMVMGLLGLLTGMLWANYTWGAPWTNDPKLNGAAVGMLVYLAYAVLRGSLEDRSQKARLSAVYNVFAFVIYIVFIYVVPRLTDSLHPGNGGNPAFSEYDLDNTMRLFFYPAVIGWTLLAAWMGTLWIRIGRMELKEELG